MPLRVLIAGVILALVAVSGPAWAEDKEAAAVKAGWRWRVPMNTTWDYRLIEPPASVPAGVKVIVSDLFDTPAARVRAFRAKGVRSICYLNAGAWEDWRSDAKAYPAAVKGKKYEGWPGERWLDIRRLDVLGPILRKRMDLCKAKGFLAVDPDNLDGWQNDTGFPLTKADQIRFNTWLAREAHKRGLSIGLKNAPELAPKLVSLFDFTIVESCVAQKWCHMTQPFRAAGKAVLAVEYTDVGMTPQKVCPLAARRSMSAIVKRRSLDGWRRACPT